MFNTSTVLNSIKIEFYLGKILSKFNLCLLELSVVFFQTLLGIWALAKNVILEVYFIDRKCFCRLLYLVFLLSFSLIKIARSFGIFSHVLIMPQVNYFSSFFWWASKGSVHKHWVVSSHLPEVQDVQNVKLLHSDHKAPRRMSPDRQFKLLQLTCLILPETNEGAMTRVAPW